MNDDHWHSVIDASCNVFDLRIESVCPQNGPSQLTAFVLRREQELLIADFDLEAALRDAL